MEKDWGNRGIKKKGCGELKKRNFGSGPMDWRGDGRFYRCYGKEFCREKARQLRGYGVTAT